MLNLARAYRGRPAGTNAFPLDEEALKAQASRLGPGPPGRPWGRPLRLADLPAGAALRREGSRSSGKAAEWQRKRVEAVSDPARSSGAGLVLGSLLAQLGDCLLNEGKHAEAKGSSESASTIREKEQPEAWTTANARSLLGGALLGQKEFAEAEPLLLAGYEELKQREKPRFPRRPRSA